MMSKPLAAGAFLWVFADEGVERKDLNDSIDTEKNRGPDGILGPYTKKRAASILLRKSGLPYSSGRGKLLVSQRADLP